METLRIYGLSMCLSPINTFYPCIVTYYLIVDIHKLNKELYFDFYYFFINLKDYTRYICSVLT